MVQGDKNVHFIVPPRGQTVAINLKVCIVMSNKETSINNCDFQRVWVRGYVA